MSNQHTQVIYLNLAEILLEHRAEVVDMLLTEFNEEAFVRDIREEGHAEGHAEGVLEATLASIRNLMDTLNLTMEQAMVALKIPEIERPEYARQLEQRDTES